MNLNNKKKMKNLIIVFGVIVAAACSEIEVAPTAISESGIIQMGVVYENEYKGFLDYSYFTKDSVFNWNKVDAVRGDKYIAWGDSLLVGDNPVNKAVFWKVPGGFAGYKVRLGPEKAFIYIAKPDMKIGEL